MKSNFFKFLLICLFVFNNALANQFTFESSKIDVSEGGNIIYATEGKALSVDKDIEIEDKVNFTRRSIEKNQIRIPKNVHRVVSPYYTQALPSPNTSIKFV